MSDKRSTLSGSNKRSDVQAFEDIYHGLLKMYNSVLSDSRIVEIFKKQVKILGSYTISLLKDILRNSKSGKGKGGIKAYTVLNADEIVPELI